MYATDAACVVILAGLGFVAIKRYRKRMAA